MRINLLSPIQPAIVLRTEDSLTTLIVALVKNLKVLTNDKLKGKLARKKIT